jgi:nitronate monooxygenase
VISTAFGVLPAPQMKEARSAGAKVVAMATSVEEAVWAEAQGADVIVAQGGEAGGHRGTFDVRKHPLGCSVGTFALVPQVADRVRVPVVAAGGVMDGRGLVAALVLGAKGVQMGTRFLTSAESGAHPAYKQALLQSDETSTEITTAFSGRPARGVKNRFMQQWSESGTEPFPFPLQNALTREIRNAAAAQHNAQYMSLWAGQGQRMLTPGEPAAVIFRRIIREAQEILG